MLTRDFTCSRKRSQEFVAVVIASEKLTPFFPQMWICCGKQVPSLSFSGFGNHARTGASCFPLAPRAWPFWICRPLEQPSSDSAGLSPIGTNGASEKCAKGISAVHTSFTVFPQAPFLCNAPKEHSFSPNFSHNFRARTELCTGAGQIALRIFHLFLRFFIGPRELIDAQRVASDDQAVLFDQDRVRFQARFLRRIDFVGGAAIPLFVKMQQV